jgi:hypothetical protein
VVAGRKKPSTDPGFRLNHPWRRPLLRWLLQGLAAIAALSLILAGFIWLGDLAREHIRPLDRYQFLFLDIDCKPPPGLERQQFLEQVQYYGRLPERFSVLDEGLAAQLTAAFALHPWVAHVQHVNLIAPRTVQVELAYRHPVLAIAVGDDRGSTGLVRAVDADGVLLPKAAAFAGNLPVLAQVAGPTGPEGRLWGDPIVSTAAQAAVLLQPHQQRLELMKMKATPNGLELWSKNLKVRWGGESADEPPPATKLERLLNAVSDPGHLAAAGSSLLEVDLRPKNAAVVRVLQPQ